MVLESVVEARLKVLESYGFEVLKLRTPGYNGTKDRLVLAPKWSPSRTGPVMVEIKAPGKHERLLQAAVRDDWRARGCDVRDMCSTFEQIDVLCDNLLIEAVERACWVDMPDHIRRAYAAAKARKTERMTKPLRASAVEYAVRAMERAATDSAKKAFYGA